MPTKGQNLVFEIPDFQLNDGNSIPVIGLGTYQAPREETALIVRQALEIGYRHLDCAYFYKNEEAVGEALTQALQSGLIKRQDVFITTKVWPTWFGSGRPEKSVKRSLTRLGIDYVDLILIHWPTPFKQVDDEEIYYPVDNDGKIQVDETIQLIDVWREFEQIKDQGLTKSIGVSNFNSKQIQQILNNELTVPAINQIECHPYFSQEKLIDWCRSNGIQCTAYSPLARSGTPEKKNSPSPLIDETILSIARNHQVTAAQVCIRWQAQRGMVVIPKTMQLSHLKCNFDVFSFELSQQEMMQINSLNRNIRNNVFNKFSIDKSKGWPFALEF